MEAEPPFGGHSNFEDDFNLYFFFREFLRSLCVCAPKFFSFCNLTSDLSFVSLPQLGVSAVNRFLTCT